MKYEILSLSRNQYPAHRDEQESLLAVNYSGFSQFDNLGGGVFENIFQYLYRMFPH
jgi:hypothetical protein